MNKGKENDAKPRTSRKRKSEGDSPVKAKKLKIKAFKPPSDQPAASSSDLPVQTSPSKTLKVTLKLPPPPKPKEPETFPCCLCPSMSKECLLRVQDPPAWWYSSDNAEAAKGPCMAHVDCANVIPETWVDEIEIGEPDMDGVRPKENVIFGVDGIVKDRWNLVSAHLPSCLRHALITVDGCRNARRARSQRIVCTVRLSNAPRASVPKPSTSRARVTDTPTGSYIACSGRSRRRSYCWITRLLCLYLLRRLPSPPCSNCIPCLALPPRTPQHPQLRCIWRSIRR